MEPGRAGRIGSKGQPRAKPARLALKMLEMWRGNARAIAASHQYAILGSAHIGDAHGEPQSDGGQRDGKGERRDIRQHAAAKIVRFAAVPFIARQIVRLLPDVLRWSVAARVSPLARWMRQRARPEFEHAMLFFRRNRLLDFHCCQLRYIVVLFSTLAMRLTENVDMAGMR